MLPDAKSLMLDLLKGADIPVSASVKPSGNFVTVTLLGGDQLNSLQDRWRLKLRAYGASPADSHRLASSVVVALDDFDPPIFVQGVQIDAVGCDGLPVEMYDMDVKRPYSQILYGIVTERTF